MLIGFSTGTLKQTGLSFVERIRFFRSLGCQTLELGLRSGDQFFQELAEGRHLDMLSDFKFISMHAEKKNFLSSLDMIEKIHSLVNLKGVVIHPDLVEDFSVFERFTFPVAIENMDNKKVSFQRTEELMPIFEKHPGFKAVIDLNHAYLNDRSLDLTRDLVEKFSSRLSHFHISGFREEGGELVDPHLPLFETKQPVVIPEVKALDASFIIESDCATLKHAEKELEYIKNLLK